MNKIFRSLLPALSLLSLATARADVIYVAEEQLLRVSIAQVGSAPQPFANGVGLVYGLTLDSSGNLYAAGAGNDTIYKAAPTGAVTVYASNITLGSPNGLAFDASGNLFTTGFGYGGTVNRISPNGTITRVVTGVGGLGLAFDANGNLYVAGGSIVTKITPGGVASTFASGFNNAWGIAFDRNGNLFVANAFGDSISKVTPNGTVSLFASGLDYPTGLAFDSSGDLYVCNITRSQPLGYVSRISPTGTVSTFAAGFNYPTAIAIKTDGSVINTNYAPIANCRDITISAGSDCAASASVNSGSSDPDGDAITLTQTPPGPYPIGTTRVLLTVTDSKGASNSCNAIVTVLDATSPIIFSASVTPNVLWPPNHQMVAVTVNALVADSCGSVTWKIISVQSNESSNGPGDGNTAHDWTITGDHTVNLRAERSGKGQGRIYSIAIQAKDAAGNLSETKVLSVTVPKSAGPSK